MNSWLGTFVETCCFVGVLSVAVVLGVVCVETLDWITDHEAKLIAGAGGLIGLTCGTIVFISIWWEIRT